MNLEQAIEIATRRFLPPGYKPEDYLMVDDKAPLRIASMIVREALYLIEISKKYGFK